jgi:tRNA G18 (ribose-2'-O)-methylase SpoU
VSFAITWFAFPMVGKVESLNASVAAVCIYEALRQHCAVT